MEAAFQKCLVIQCLHVKHQHIPFSCLHLVINKQIKLGEMFSTVHPMNLLPRRSSPGMREKREMTHFTSLSSSVVKCLSWKQKCCYLQLSSSSSSSIIIISCALKHFRPSQSDILHCTTRSFLLCVCDCLPL